MSTTIMMEKEEAGVSQTTSSAKYSCFEKLAVLTLTGLVVYQMIYNYSGA